MTAINPYGSMFPPLPEKETATTTHGPDVTTPQLSPYQVDTDRQRAELVAAQIKTAEDEKKRAEEKARTQAGIDKAIADEAAAQGKARADAYAKTEESIGAATQRLTAARQRFENEPPVSLFGDRDTWGKALGAMGMLFAAAGDAQKAKAAALLGQQASGPSFLTGVVQMDLQRQREKLGKMSDEALMAQTGLKDAREARQAALAEVDLRGALAYKRLAAIGKANLSSKGMDDATIEGDQRIQALRAEEVKQRDAVGSHLTQQIVKPGTDVTTTTRENKPGTQAKPGVEDVKETNRLDADILKLTQTIEAIEKNPTAWNEYRQNEEDWARSEAAKGGVVGEVRKVGQAAGLFNVAPEQGLKTDDGRRVHQGMSQVKTSIAKGYGGVITDGDRGAAASELATLGLDSPQAIATLKRAREVLENGRASFYANRGIQPAAPAGPAAPTAPPGEQSTAAGGAAHGTRDTRGDADAQPHESAPGPAVETPANNPDNPNSMAKLPEDPAADSLPEATRAPTPRKLPGGVASLGKAPQGAPVAAPSGKVYTDQQQRYISIVKSAPGLKNAGMMRRLGLSEEDFR